MERILFLSIVAAMFCGSEGSLEHQGEDCWNSCSTYDEWIQEEAGGPCSFCGSDGMCCRRGWKTDLGCDGSIGTDGYHGCVPKPGILEHQNEDCYNQCGGDGYPCSWCGTDGICCRKGWWYGKNGCDSSMGTSGYHGCVAKPVDRTWNCNYLDKWDSKTYELYREDFCEKEWHVSGWWWDKTGSQPTCDEKIAPTVTFYLEGSSDKICSIDMNQGRGAEYNKCLDAIKASANQETWFVHLVHGFTAWDDWYPGLSAAFVSRYATTGRNIIFSKVNWSHGAKGEEDGANRMSIDHKWQGSSRKHTPEERIIDQLIYGISPEAFCSEVGAQSGYLEAASNTMVVGHLLGLLTEDVVNLGISNLKTMCVGHSLGGHVCGFTGKTKQLDAIVGLDTAGPIFEPNSPHNRLNKGDAKVVYQIHTNTAFQGIKKPIGDYDIYVNGGKNQPDCGANSSCSHSAFIMGFMEKIWKQGPCVFGKIVPDLGETSPGAYTPGVHGVRTTDQGCEFTIDGMKTSIGSDVFNTVFGK